MAVKNLIEGVLTRLNEYLSKRHLSRHSDGLYDVVAGNFPYSSQFGCVTRDKAIEELDVSVEFYSDQGYPSRKEFQFWNRRVCGVICVKMLLDYYFSNPSITVWELLQEGIKNGGYILYDRLGRFVDLGWFHDSLLLLLKQRGLHGFLAQRISIFSVSEYLCNKCFVIASIKVPDRAYLADCGDFFEEGYSGKIHRHLVLLTAVELKGGKPVKFIAQNPTGLLGYGKDSKIKAAVFEKIFNNRAIVVTG